MTKFEKEAFALIKPQTLVCEELICDWRDGYKLVRFDLGVCPVNIDVWTPDGEEFEEGKEYKIKLLLFQGSEFLKGPNEIFHNEEEYYRERTMKSMAVESIIPSGTFSPKADPKFKENASVILQAKIESVEKVRLAGENAFHIVLKMQDKKFDTFFHDGVLPFAEPGNIISSVYTAVGEIVK